MGNPSLTARSEPPAVSVIVPAYNARAMIRRALDSALGQTFDDLEVVVVDDASTDGTTEFVEHTCGSDARLRVIGLERNGGPARARNIGIAAARGRWIALLDSDDAWRPQRLRRLLEHSDDADAVFDNLAGYDAAEGTETGRLFPVFPANITVEALLAPQAAGTSYDFGYLKPMLRREFLMAREISYDETLRVGEDLLLYLTLLLEGARTRLVDEPLYVYTLPVGAAGRSSTYSHTRPRDHEVRRSLARLLARYRDRISSETAGIIQRRVDFLRRIAPISEFYFARRQRRYGRMALLFARHFAVQREAIGKLLGVSLRQ